MIKSEVYFLKLNELEKIRKLMPDFFKPLGIKVHFGEEGNTTFIPAKYIKQIVAMCENPTLIECSVLYRSPRRIAKTHRELALKHGFDFAPIDFLDGDVGDDTKVIEIEGKHFVECYLGQGIEKYNSILAISHFKGHNGTGFGGALKNMGMGLASRQGKLAQHASIKHQVKEEKCIGCGECMKHCPVDAISLNSNNKAQINQKKCISCSKCISVCPESAIRIPWDSHGSDVLQERIAEYALAAIQNRQCFYINLLLNITADCDCQSKTMEPLTSDIGVLVSRDPVAIDQASYDMVVRQYEKFKEYNGDYQLAHAESLNLGKREYEIKLI